MLPLTSSSVCNLHTTYNFYHKSLQNFICRPKFPHFHFLDSSPFYNATKMAEHDDILEDMRRELTEISESNNSNTDEMNATLADIEFLSTKPSSVLDQETQQQFIIKDLIGYSSSSRQIPVYNTTIQSDSDHDQLCYSIKLVKKSEQTFVNLVQEAERNSLIPDHKNIMGIDKKFESDNLFCVAFPSIGLGSLRGITNSLFSDGLPEECIVVALKEALQGLSFVHENGQVHKQINAGHIFMDSKGEIKIGFSATVYDDNKSLNHPSSSLLLSPISIFKWGAAPEVYDLENDADLYTAKSDIWLIGMTALELAFGNRLRIMSRRAMDIMFGTMHRRERLFLQQKQGKDHYDINGNLNEVNRVFSDEFQKMVIKCLSIDAEARPTAAELLESRIFREREDVVCFHQLVKENQNKRK